MGKWSERLFLLLVSVVCLAGCLGVDDDASPGTGSGGSSSHQGDGGSAAVGGGGLDGTGELGGAETDAAGGDSSTAGSGGSRGKGTDYYCDPVHGLPDNPGTSTSPWRTLEEVFSDERTFSEGDIIYLRTGNHGSPVVGGAISSGGAQIAKQLGETPVLKRLEFSAGASGWTVDGVLVSPQEADGNLTNAALVVFDAGATRNVLKSSELRYAPDTIAATWDNSDWIKYSGVAVDVFGPDNQILDNKIRNTHVGVMLERTSTAGAGATGTLVRGNSVTHFWEDAYRCRVGNSTFEYNTAVNSYAVVPADRVMDPPHRDMFQAYRGDGSFTPMDGVVLRGNIFIARQGERYTKVPFQFEDHYTIQGVGAFDGPYNNWVIENNVIMVEVGLAMGLYGMNDSKIANNTVIPDPFGSASEIRVANQKDGTPSNNNIIVNNLARTMNISAATNAQASNNMEVAPASYPNYFVDYAAGDVRLKAGSPAIDSGTTTDAPTLDADGFERAAPIDVGAYEYRTP